MIFDTDQRFVKLLQNWSPHLLFLKCSLKKFLKIFLEKVSGRSNFFIISKRQSWLNNKFYARNQTLQGEAISSIVRID